MEPISDGDYVGFDFTFLRVPCLCFPKAGCTFRAPQFPFLSSTKSYCMFFLVEWNERSPSEIFFKISFCDGQVVAPVLLFETTIQSIAHKYLLAEMKCHCKDIFGVPCVRMEFIATVLLFSMFVFENKSPKIFL